MADHDRDAGAPAAGAETCPGDVGHGLERLTFFSDAVIAIALTILAIELPLPSGDTNAALWRSFAHLLPRDYFSFALSFVVIATFWATHHRFFGDIARLERGLVARNMTFLFAIVALPYATRLLGISGGLQLGTVLYASIVALAGASMLVMVRFVATHRLMRADVPPWRTTARLRGLGVPTLAFLISIPVAFGSTTVARYLWLVLPVGATLVLRSIRHIRRRAAG